MSDFNAIEYPPTLISVEYPNIPNDKIEQFFFKNISK
jgi:hypothetical protein